MLHDFTGGIWEELNMGPVEKIIAAFPLMITTVDAHIRLVDHFRQPKFEILCLVAVPFNHDLIVQSAQTIVAPPCSSRSMR